MIKEFKEFIDKGSFIDIAVGFAMGVAFTAIVTTFVERIINPALALIFSLDNLDELWTFGENGSFGALLGAIINFVAVALFLFFVVRSYNRYKAMSGEEGVDEAPAEPSEDVLLLREIRDSLARH